MDGVKGKEQGQLLEVHPFVTLTGYKRASTHAAPLQRQNVGPRRGHQPLAPLGDDRALPSVPLLGWTLRWMGWGGSELRALPVLTARRCGWLLHIGMRKHRCCVCALWLLLDRAVLPPSLPPLTGH